MKYLPFRKSDLWIALGFLVCYIAIFDSKLDLGGDNAGYYILAQALHGGDGYTDIHLPGAPAAKHFPPGYPVLMAVCMAVSDSFYFLKVLNGVLFLASLLMLQRLFERMTQNQTLAWVALALTLLNAHLLRSSTILMSEIPFLFFSVATLSCLVKWRSGDKPFWQSPWFWAMLILSSISYHIRTAGLALIAGIGLYLLFEKKWAEAIGYGVGFMALALPWFMRGKALGGNPYLAQLIQVNPYRPEEGVLTLGGWVTRIQSNGWRYLTQEIPNGLFPKLEVVYSQEEPTGFFLYGVMLVILIGIGTWKMPRLRMLWAGYLLASAAIFLLWPEVWFGVRFMQPLIPFLLLAATVGAWELLKAAQTRVHGPTWLTSPYLWALMLLVQLPAVKAQHEKSKESIGTQYSNYFNVGRYVSQNLPAEAIIATYKPGLFYLYAQRPCVRFPSLEDSEEFINKLKEQGVTHVVVDQLGYSAIGRYVVPAIQAAPERFPLVLQLPNPDTYLLELR